MRLTSVSLDEASSNGDGTYSAIKAMRWIYESITGKELSDEEALKAYEEAKVRAKERGIGVDLALKDILLGETPE